MKKKKRFDGINKPAKAVKITLKDLQIVGKAIMQDGILYVADIEPAISLIHVYNIENDILTTK